MNFIFISPNFPHTYWNFCDPAMRRMMVWKMVLRAL